jgi:ATP-dependent helicase/DNAse subunit B
MRGNGEAAGSGRSTGGPEGYPTRPALRLVTGPAGSGKTAYVLERFREALRVHDAGVRLLVPTATMAQHLQNEIAREGFVFRRNLIQTLSHFIESHVTDYPQAPEPVLYLMVEEAVARVGRPEFRRVADLPGFCAALARTIAEFSSAGCDSARLAAYLPDSPLAAGFLAIYEEVDRALDRRGLLLRAKRLECAAARIHAQGPGEIHTVWLDGFHALPDPELEVIRSLAQHAEVTLTLAEDDVQPETRERLRALGVREEALAPRGAAAQRVLVRAPNIEREAEEIARRIAEQAAAGRPFREMAIVVRAADTYIPLLRSTLDRFGIPARFYFETEAEQHPAIRFLRGAIETMLGGWDHTATLAVLRLAPRFSDSSSLDRFDFSVREQIPNTGLGPLRALIREAGSPLGRLLDSLASLEEWRSFQMKPADWVARFRTLRNLYRPARPSEAAGHELALLWRSHAGALDLFDEALAEAAQALDRGKLLGLPEYWRVVRSVLRLKPLRLWEADRRRNVVHVLSAHEARQWVLPVVFVCGVVEKEFPQFHPQDAFFPEGARLRLNAAGIRVRTAVEFEREERRLFDSALTRATTLVTLSYPEFDARGDRHLPSLFLEDLGLEAEKTRTVRPRPRSPFAPPRPAAIVAPALLRVLREKTAKVSPSGLESYLQCPFQYFAGRTLRLRSAPPRPDERLDFSLQGEIVHAVLAEWVVQRQPIAALFQRIFEEQCEKKQVRAGYHTERLRNAMLQDLERFVNDETWPRERFRSSSESKFELLLASATGQEACPTTISGRVDRIDTGPDGRAYILDYKYSMGERVKERKNGEGLQAPLYVMAAEKVFGVQPAGMFFVGLKGAVTYAGWSEEGLLEADAMPADWIENTAARIHQLVAEIREGRVAPAPANPESCRFCEDRDICRIETRRGIAVPESA